MPAYIYTFTILFAVKRREEGEKGGRKEAGVVRKEKGGGRREGEEREERANGEHSTQVLSLRVRREQTVLHHLPVQPYCKGIPFKERLQSCLSSAMTLITAGPDDCN